MQIDIPAHIEKLLFLHDALVIPGFGGFTATRTPAATDYVGGVVHPPAKTLAFSENLTIDDGLLTADIADTHSILTEDAGNAVSEFVEKMRQLLDQREIITLPGVGRLYKNYVQKIQFLPDATNFNAASYGLPPLQFSPIARSREVEQAPTRTSSASVYTPPTSTPTPPPPSMPEPTYAPERGGAGSKTGAIAGVFFLLVALAAAFWYWQHRQKAQEIAQETPKEDVTPAPAPSTAPAPAPAPVQSKPAVPSPEAGEKASQESLKLKEKEAKEQLNLAKNGRECILIIATLSSDENAAKLRQLLQEEDYQEYYEKRGSAHLVGVRFKYLKATEIDEKKKALSALTGVNIIVVKKR